MLTVIYWRGTTQLTEYVPDGDDALEIADRNQNAWPPRFYDEDGSELFYDGTGFRADDDEGFYRY